MIQIFLDGKEVIPVSGKTIKITNGNPSLTEKGTYSLDIEFSLDVLANRQFFGPLCRSEVSKSYSEYTAEVKEGTRTIIGGQAKITKVTEKVANIQIKSEPNAKSANSTMDNVYIDQINLGLLDIRPDGANWNMYYTGGSRQYPFVPLPDWEIEVDYSEGSYARDPHDRSFLYAMLPLDGQRFVGNKDIAIFTPVYDETNDVDRNVTRLYQVWEGQPFTVVQRIDTPQPNLMFMVKNIFEMMGYSVNLGQYGHVPFTKMYIANAHPTQALSYTLPHWTVNEFIEQIELFLGCSVMIDEIKKSVTLKPVTSTSYETKTLNVIDEFETEIDTDEDAESKFKTAANLSYDLSESPAHIYDRLTDEVLQSFEIKEYESYQKMVEAYEACNESVKSHAIFKCPNGYYCRGYIDKRVGSDEANYQWTLLKVHHFGDYINNEKTEDRTKIKICPTAITEYNACRLTYYNVWYDYRDWFTLCASLKNERTAGDKNTTVWEGITEGVEDMDDTPPEDRMQIFFFDGVTYNGKIDNKYEVYYPNPWVDHEYMNVYENDQPITDRPSWSLSMDEHNSAEFSMAHLHLSQKKIEICAAHTFRFLATTPPDVSQVFLIKGKKYLCEKIEYDINDDGIMPVMTGYFYEITE